MRLHRTLACSRLLSMRKLLIALFLLLTYGSFDPTQTQTREGGSQLGNQVGSEATQPGPAVTPTPSPTPSPIPSATPSPSPADKPWWLEVSSVKWGDREASGPLIFVLIVFVLIMISSVLAIKKLREGALDFSKKRKVALSALGIFLLLGAVSIFLAGIVLGSRNTSSPVPIPIPTPTTTPPITAPTESPTAEPTAEPTAAPSPSPNPSPSPLTRLPSPNAERPSTPLPLSLSVEDVSVAGRNETDKLAGLGNTLIIRVTNLREELKNQQAFSSERPRIDTRNYVLFLDGMEISKLYPIAIDPEASALHFKLNRTPESKDVWAHLLAGRITSTQQTKASVGLEGMSPIPNGQNFSLRIYSTGWMLFWLISNLFVVFICTWLGSRTTIFREPAYGLHDRQWGPYSLARLQLAWWTFIMIESFFFIAILSGDFEPITTSSAILLGISMATALCSAMIDAYTRVSAEKMLVKFESQQAELVQDVDQLEKTITLRKESQADDNARPGEATHDSELELTAKRAQLERVKQQATDTAYALRPRRSKGLLHDILSGSNGPGLANLQLVLWTIFLGVVFITMVWRKWAMPEFDGALLLLLGLCAATYLSFKILEKFTPPRV